MRTLIAVPCLDMVHTYFMVSLLGMTKPEGTEITVSGTSLVYDARNMLAHKAVHEGYDRVLWLDSDMHFPADLLPRLAADLDEGREFVSAVYFTRKDPIEPCIYEVCHDVETKRGEIRAVAQSVKAIPEHIFEIEGCGFGAVMMTTDLIRRVGRLPFFPEHGYGEDLSFCRRAREAGAKLFCDGRIKVDHIGTTMFNNETWLCRGGGENGG